MKPMVSDGSVLALAESVSGALAVSSPTANTEQQRKVRTYLAILQLFDGIVDEAAQLERLQSAAREKQK